MKAKKEKEELIKQKYKQRARTAQKLTAKTQKGQPVMKHSISALLQKLERNNKNSNNDIFDNNRNNKNNL